MVKELIAAHRLISDQVDARELGVILSCLESVLRKEVPGDIVEFGCYEGTASLFLQRMIITSKVLSSSQRVDTTTGLEHKRRLWVYDSFEGLPAKTKEDESPLGADFKQGSLKASKDQFIKNFRQARLPLPIIHKGWFSDIRPHELPDTIAFTFLDGDYYESIRDSLGLIENKLVRGGCVVIDDYSNEKLPGVRRATDAWLTRRAANGYTLSVRSSLAVIYTLI